MLCSRARSSEFGFGRKSNPTRARISRRRPTVLAPMASSLQKLLLADGGEVLDAENAQVSQGFACTRAHRNFVDRRLGLQLNRRIQPLRPLRSPIERGKREGRIDGNRVFSERDGVLALGFDDGCAQCAKACQQFSVWQLRQIVNGSDGSMRHGTLY